MYLVFGTILLVCCLFIYCQIRRKVLLSPLAALPIKPQRKSTMAIMEAVELGAISQTILDH